MAEENKKSTGRPLEMADELEQTIPKNYQQAFARVVAAGSKFMFSSKTHKFMIDELSKEGDLAERIGKAVAGLMVLLFNQSNKKMPQPVIVPAGTYLLFQGADFLEQVTGEEVSPEILADAMEIMTNELVKLAGVDPQRLLTVAEKAAQGGYR